MLGHDIALCATIAAVMFTLMHVHYHRKVRRIPLYPDTIAVRSRALELYRSYDALRVVAGCCFTVCFCVSLYLTVDIPMNFSWTGAVLMLAKWITVILVLFNFAVVSRYNWLRDSGPFVWSSNL